MWEWLDAETVIKFGERLGLPGLITIILLAFIFYIFKTYVKSNERRFVELRETYEKELDRHVQEKNKLQELFLKQIPSSSRGNPPVELKTVLDDMRSASNDQASETAQLGLPASPTSEGKEDN